MPAVFSLGILGNRRRWRAGFRFIEGPCFCQLLMAMRYTALRRARSRPCCKPCRKKSHPRGHTALWARPFHVLATQNPIEQEGTYPLPEAQLDRFLLQVNVDYPTRAHERDILLATTGATETEAHQVFSAENSLLRKPCCAGCVGDRWS